GELHAARLEALRGAFDVVEPAASALGARSIEIERFVLAEALRDDAHDAIVARRPGDVGAAIDGHRQCESVVVIGMFANQIDATRRGEDPRLLPIRRAKDVSDGLEVAHAPRTITDPLC